MGNLIELNRFVTFIITKNIVKLGFFIQIIFVISVRTNNLFLTLFVKIKVLVAYAVPKNYVVVKLLIIQMYTALFPFNRGRIYPEWLVSWEVSTIFFILAGKMAGYKKYNYLVKSVDILVFINS